MSQVQISSPASSNLSLLSLSIAASNAAPIASPSSPSADSLLATSKPALQGLGNSGHTKHRRLSSAGRSRRRLSDARDAATRPSPASLQSTSMSLAALSLSSPTVPNRPAVVQTASGVQQSLSTATSAQISMEDTSQVGSVDGQNPPTQGGNGNPTRTGKKRGHPSCLIKHRWEHTPQWREASKFVLSKHQQVQLLEVMPALVSVRLYADEEFWYQDRSLWPSFLSGGLVPPPAHSTYDAANSPDILNDYHTSPSSIPPSYPISSSVPASTMSSITGLKQPRPTGPRLHDYAIPQGVTGLSGVTQLRPGLLGVPTVSPQSPDYHSTSLVNLSSRAALDATSSPTPVLPSFASGPTAPASSDAMRTAIPVPVPVPSNATTAHNDALNLLSLRTASVRSADSSCGSSRSYDISASPYSPSYSFGGASAFTGSRFSPFGYGAMGTSGYPGCKTEEAEVLGLSVREEEDEDEGRNSASLRTKAPKKVEQWDGMEMEMEMD
ncbi:hypothetical protein ID866_4230 [Astraeus odoratus]|nr:hypothetical protein ID866_4230 [Astraeus odoratus]